jgi:hypothetical protein
MAAMATAASEMVANGAQGTGDAGDG